MQDKKSNFAILFLNRLKSALKISTDNDLAKFLGVKQNTVSSWRSRNTIDYDLIISKCDNVSFDWLISGTGKVMKDGKNENVELRTPFNKDNITNKSYDDGLVEGLRDFIKTREMMLIMKDEIIALKDQSIKDKETIIAELRKNNDSEDKKFYKQMRRQKI